MLKSWTIFLSNSAYRAARQPLRTRKKVVQKEGKRKEKERKRNAIGDWIRCIQCIPLSFLFDKIFNRCSVIRHRIFLFFPRSIKEQRARGMFASTRSNFFTNSFANLVCKSFFEFITAKRVVYALQNCCKRKNCIGGFLKVYKFRRRKKIGENGRFIE